MNGTYWMILLLLCCFCNLHRTTLGSPAKGNFYNFTLWYYCSQTKLSYNIFHEKLYHFDECIQKCFKENGEMVSVRSTAENEFVYELAVHLFNGYGVLETITDRLWLGTHRVRNTWINIDSSQQIYANWADGEPSDVGGVEACATMYWLEDYYYAKKWNNVDCDLQMKGCVCKRSYEPNDKVTDYY